MIEYLSNRGGMMKDNDLALRVLVALRAVSPNDWIRDGVWVSMDTTASHGIDILAFGGRYAHDELLHISLFRYTFNHDEYFRVDSCDNPFGTATMTMDSMKVLFGVSLRLD